MFGAARESRQVTLANARKKIRAVGEQLRLNSSCIDIAFNLYKRALQKRLTHGRKNTHVVAACIYITCRVEATSHMLLVLSDVMQVNVYELGRTYLKLSSSLHINIPAIDPCIYIVRFASKLDLGDKAHEIEMTAMRIAQRMKRDWMHFGRRPSGLCGSALLVAARLHDVHCSIKEIIRVVKVCEATIRKRLTEFGDTPTSRLTLEEFMQVDLEGEEDPPCFKAARLKKETSGNSTIIPETVETTVSKLEQQIEQELEKNRKNRRNPYENLAASSEVATDVVDQFILQETLGSVLGEEDAMGSCLDQEENQILLPSASVLKLTDSPFKVPTSLPPGRKRRRSETEEESLEKETQEKQEDSGLLETDDLNDEELDSYILNDQEASLKRTIWEKVNAEWIQEMEEKAKRKLEEEAEMRLKESKGELPPPKKKRKVKKRVVIQANSAGEAIEKMLQEKRISNKINYDVLRQLDGLNSDVGFSAPPAAPDSGVESHVQSTTPVATSRRLPSIRNYVSTHIRLPTSTRSRSRASSVTSSFRDRRDSVSSVMSHPQQNEKLEDDKLEEETDKTKRPIQEQEPVVPDDDDEEEEEEEVEQNESNMSIAQLMSQRLGSGIEMDHEDHLTDQDDY